MQICMRTPQMHIRLFVFYNTYVKCKDMGNAKRPYISTVPLLVKAYPTIILMMRRYEQITGPLRASYSGV